MNTKGVWPIWRRERTCVDELCRPGLSSYSTARAPIGAAASGVGGHRGPPRAVPGIGRGSNSPVGAARLRGCVGLGHAWGPWARQPGAAAMRSGLAGGDTAEHNPGLEQSPGPGEVGGSSRPWRYGAKGRDHNWEAAARGLGLPALW
ncbi:hypothetical protein NDU88_006870 [Pleurodeles waltl]|uniref:Uncharacterized protein n=1 Tax=Pleurodeles waltl TaxID=8319 RepID=A0AAV7QJ60_PLEWA|nr:hypothetical protein NDU88_006870 [Pleurodeles waltl]